ncbi:formylglycine-generating enzyme family protein [Armatimonas rosea]|uniref:Formylglycine-generating enzyme required for sulfatase activity n=1 Tax=Armatimonas rosea TaxID=685828 RepID=A0A7W9SNZ4_ARMRO|nr:SUMF1/EgtB/PvdO family nonheme iron enzyme [Armatimonas rosea]MBB6050157.1 formylglycine-generating enzyme required for sulfatase activity [Armatimonas rosea]
MPFRDNTPMLDQYRRELILIPEGEFLRGGTTGDEKPAQKLALGAYRIGKNLVTVALYEEFCRATKRPLPKAPVFNPGFTKKDHPIVNVSWDDARALADWARLTLPTEAQWEKAARGTDGRLYPWGPSKPESARGHFPLLLMRNKNFSNNLPRVGTATVGRYRKGASPYGVLDMAGNVWEWCADWYDEDYYKKSPLKDPTGPASSRKHFRVLRGGGWADFTDKFQCSHRSGATPNTQNDNTGIRLAAPAR